MKILFVVNSLNNGGAERVCSELSSAFSLTNEVSVLVTSVKTKAAYDVGNAKVFYLNGGKKTNPLIKPTLCYKWMKKNRPDVVIAFPDPCSFYGSFAAKRLKIPCICSERNAPMFQPTGFIMRAMRKIAYSFASAVVFQTSESLNWFPRKIRKKGFVIWNPYEHVANNSNVCNKKLDAILSIGRIVPQKNHALLLKSFSLFNKQYPNVELHVFGNGDIKLLNDLKELASNLGISEKVVFKGFSNEIKTVLKQYPIFALSSDHEGMPNALLEAAVSGLTCISTNCPVGGPREILSGCNKHYLVDCGDYLSMANAMSLAYKNREKDESDLLQYSKQLLEKCSIKKICSEWMDVIINVTSRTQIKKRR